MLAGRKAKYARIRVGLSVSSSGGLTGDGTPTYQYAASMTSAYIFNSVLLTDGITIGGYSNTTDPETLCYLSLPDLGINDTSGSAAYGSSFETYVDLVDVALYEHYTSPWFLEIGSVEWYVGGVLTDTYGGGSLNATGLAPGYVPLFGLPFNLNCSVGPGVTGLTIPSDLSYDVTQSATAVGSLLYQEYGSSDWIALPLAHLPETTPSCFTSCDLCYDTAGIVTGDDTSELTLAISSTFGFDMQAFGGEYFSRERQIHQVGSAYMVPMLDKTVTKLGDSYAAVIARAGFPYTKYRGTRRCGPTTPPGTGGPYPSPYFRSEQVEGEVHPEYSYVEGTIRDTWDTKEAPLDSITYVPYSAARSYLQSGWIGLGLFNGDPIDESQYPDHLLGQKQESVSFTFPSKTQSRTKFGDPNGDMLPYLDWNGGGASPTELDNVLFYWSYICHPHWSYVDAPGNYTVDGSSTSFQEYWGPLGEQVTNEGTRTTRISAHLMDTANVQFIEEKAFGVKTSWFGVCSFQIDKPTLLTEMTALGPDRWTLTGATGVFTSTTLTLTPTADAVKAEYDLADWGDAPYMRSQWVQDWVLDWDATNIASIKFTLVGREGSKVVLAQSPDVPDTYPWPVSGLGSKKNVGTHAQDWGVGAVSDTGTDLKPSGQSAAAMADNQRVIAPQLLSARSAAKLVIEIVPTDPGDPVVIDLPIMRKPTERPYVFHESRGFASIVSADGPLIRAGQSQYWNYLIDDMQYPPVVRAPGAQQTALDWFCWWRNVLYGSSHTDGLDAQIASFFDSGIEYTIRDHVAYDTTVFLWRGETQPVGVVQNTLQPPPLALFWERDRNEYLDYDGDPCQKVWDFSQEDRIAISTVDPVELIKDPDPDWLADDTPPSGWFIRRHAHVTDGSEDDFKIRYDAKDYANWRPWHGFVWIFGEPVRGKWGDNWNLHAPWGHYHQMGYRVEDETRDYQRSRLPVPPFEITTGLGIDDAEFRASPILRSTADFAMVFTRDSSAMLCFTYDDGATFTEATVIIETAIHPTIAPLANGALLVGAFRYDEGEEGPGTIVAKILNPLSLAASAEFTFRDAAGSPISFEDDTFHFSSAPEAPDRLVLVARKAGDTGPTAFYCSDHGPGASPVATWKEI